MPAASSRTTGSATRWNSFQPLFMRHGSVQPLIVTTGWYGRPAEGSSGGCVAAVVCIGASGTAPIAALLTAAAVTSPAARRKLRLEFIELGSMSMSAGSFARLRRGAAGKAHCARRAAGERELKRRVGNPEVAQCLDVGVHRRDLLARVDEQLEDA